MEHQKAPSFFDITDKTAEELGKTSNDSSYDCTDDTYKDNKRNFKMLKSILIPNS